MAHQKRESQRLTFPRLEGPNWVSLHQNGIFKMELEVKDMTCGHCAGVVTKAVKDVDERAKVDIDVAARIVRIESAHAAGDFLSAIHEAGYTPTVRA
jgi:copper chaperone